MDSQKLKEEQLKLEVKMSKDPHMIDIIKNLREMADKSDKTQLEFKLKELAKHLQTIDSMKKSDEELIKASQIKKELLQPYNEQSQQNKVQSRFVALLLQELNLFQE